MGLKWREEKNGDVKSNLIMYMEEIIRNWFVIKFYHGIYFRTLVDIHGEGREIKGILWLVGDIVMGLKFDNI